MALTKIDIVQKVSDKLGISKNISTRIVESVFEIMKDQLSKGKRSRYLVSAISS
jgi:nucleoid DNA-binding protein